MGQFDDMANDAQRAREERTAAHKAKVLAERKQALSQYQQDAELLMTELRPVLVEAAEAFKRTNVTAYVADPISDEGPRSINPQMTFQCRGARTRIEATGGTYDPRGVIVAISAENGRISVRVGRSRNENFASVAIKGEWPNALRVALKQALDSYHEHVEEHERMI